MDYVIYCQLQNFYVNLLGLPIDRPCTVIRNQFILDSNPLAQKRGVVPGLPLSQARTILREEGIYRQLSPEEGESEQKRWLELATLFTGVIEPTDRHAAYLDLSAHPNPLDVAHTFLDQLEKQSGCTVRFGAGHAKWLAKLSTELDGERLLQLDGDGIASLSIHCISPISAEHRERLRFLGYYTAGEIACLPLATLRSQFGDEGLCIQLAAKGALNEPVKAIYPPDKLTERLIFDGACSDLLMLDRALMSLAQRIGNRLLRSEKQATEAHLLLGLEEDQIKKFTRRFNKPLSCPRTTAAALRLLLGSGFNQSVLSIAVHLPQLQRARSAQQSLTGTISSSESNDRAESALKQVRSVFGEKSIQLAGKIELPRRQRVLQEWKNATGWR